MSATDSASWRAKHALAKAELDSKDLPELVRKAEVAIFQRVLELSCSSNSLREREEILDAANEMLAIKLTKIDEPRPRLLTALNVAATNDPGLRSSAD
jgi:hypothetical protein